jgi:6-pyruvoyltetrahydropterin/6-carboxytetrahydropterin synthase
MYRIGVRGQFSAAHHLEGHPGKCSRTHGHTWQVEAVFSAQDLGSGGLVVDFEDACRALDEAIEPLDHRYLNETEQFSGLQPTAENVARVIYESLAAIAGSAGWTAHLESVAVWESPDAMALYSA